MEDISLRFFWFLCGLKVFSPDVSVRRGSPTSGTGLELDCIAAVVIGGTSFSGGIGNVSGVVIGVFIFGDYKQHFRSF